MSSHKINPHESFDTFLNIIPSPPKMYVWDVGTMHEIFNLRPGM